MRRSKQIKLRVSVVATAILLCLSLPLGASATSQITLSKSASLAYEGELVQISINNFPSKAGLYVFQCAQPVMGVRAELSKCNSADQLWITSSGRGSFLPTATDIKIRLVGKFGAIDCTVDKCGLFFEFDRFAADDRSEDQFIPLTFSDGPATGSASSQSAAKDPVKQSVGQVRTSLRVGQTLTLPVNTDKGVALSYRNTTNKICSLTNLNVKAKRTGTCVIAAYAPAKNEVMMLGENVSIKVKKK